MVRYGCVRHLHGRTPINPSAQLLALFAVLPPLLSTARLIYGLLRTEPLSTLFLLFFLFVLLPSFLVAMCFFPFFSEFSNSAFCTSIMCCAFGSVVLWRVGPPKRPATQTWAVANVEGLKAQVLHPPPCCVILPIEADIYTRISLFPGAVEPLIMADHGMSGRVSSLRPVASPAQVDTEAIQVYVMP